MARANSQSLIIKNPCQLNLADRLRQVITKVGQVGIACELDSDSSTRSVFSHQQPFAQSSYAVVLEAEQVIGVLTAQEIVSWLSTPIFSEDCQLNRVFINSVLPLTESDLTTQIAAIHLLLQRKASCLPIVDAQNQCIGLLTTESVARFSQPLAPLQLQTVADVMQTAPTVAAGDCSMAVLAQQMTQQNVQILVRPFEGNALISDPKLQPSWGIVQAQDIVQLLALGIDLSRVQAVTMMQPIATITPAETLWSAYEQIDQQGGYPLAVTSEEGLIGLLSLDDLLRAFDPLVLYQLTESCAVKLAASEPIASPLHSTTRPSQTIPIPESISYDSLMAASPVGILRTNIEGICTYVNDRYCEILGLDQTALLGQSWSVGYRPEDLQRIVTEYQEARRENRPWVIEYQIQRPDGLQVWVYGQAVVEYNTAGQEIGFMGTITDISDRKRTEILLESQHKVLEQISKAEPLSDILHALLQTTEFHLPGTLCLIMLCQEGHLYSTAAPSLHPDYCDAVNGVAYGEGVGSCGTAAFRRQMVIVSDIATDPLWQDYRALALAYNLRACWSAPIFSSEGTVLGVFGIYYQTQRTPTPQEIDRLQQSANIAGIAIEQSQATQALFQLNQELERRVEERTAALQASEERWQLALKGANDGIWDWNPQTGELFVSQRLKEMRGYDDDELPSALEDWLQLVHPDDRDRMNQAIADHLAGKTEFFQLEFRVQHKNGSYLWVLNRAQAQRDATGQVIRIIGSESDITSRKQAELALQESERLYATLAEASPVAVCRFDARLNCVYVSDRWSEMTGRPVELALGQGWIEALHPDDRDKLLAPGNDPTTQPNWVLPSAIQGCEGRHLRPDGGINWFYVQARPEFDDQGQICGCISTFTDITQLKQMEAELTASEAKFRRLVEGGQDVIWSLDRQWQFTYLSPQFQALSGWEASEWLDRSCLEAVYPDDREKILAHHAAHSQPPTKTTLEFRMLHRDRPFVWVRISSAPVLNAAGEWVGHQGTLTDITDLKCIEAELAASEAKYRQLVEGGQDLIWVMDAQDRFTYLSPQFKALFGWEPSEWIGQPCLDAVYPDDRDWLIVQQSLPSMNSKDSYLEFRHRHRDRPYIWVRVSSTPLFDTAGQWIGCQGNLTDITSLKAAELALQESERRYASLATAAPVAIFRFDQPLHCVYVNDYWSEMTGRPVESALGYGWMEALHPDDREKAISNWTQAYAQPPDPDARVILPLAEGRHLRPDGTVNWFYVQVARELDENGQVVGYIGTLTDITERKIAELALQDSQAQFQRLTENVPGAIYRCVIHPDGTDEIAYVSSQIREIFELEPEIFLQDLSQLWARIHPEDLSWLSRERQQVGGKTPQRISLAYRLLLPQKGLRWVQDMAYVERLDNGDVVFDGIILDVSDRKSIEQELILKQNHLEALLNNIPHIAWIKDAQSRFIAVNQPFAEACGFAVEHIIGLTDHDIWPAELAHVYRTDDFEVLQSGQRKVVEEPLCLANGTCGWLETTKTPFTDVNGNFAGTVGIAANISDRKQIELALEQEVLRRSTIFNASSDGIHIIDSDGNLLEANISFFQMLGYTPEEASHFNVGDWDARLTREDVQSNLQNFSWDTSRIRKVETCHRRKDGSTFPVEIYICRMEWEGGIAFICIARDISERKQAEAQLQHTNEELLRATRLKDEFLANMSHELRTPLNAILGMSEALQDQMLGLLNERQLKMVRTVERSGEHLLSLINDILDVAKIESGQIELEYAPIDVAGLCQSSLSFIKQQAFKKSIQLNIQLPTLPIPKVYLDDRRIRQVLINLLNNAVKFTLEGGCITLRVIAPWESQNLNHELSSESPMLQVSVTDTGIGIAQENISKLFQPFVQIDGALNRQYTGTGLGLALVKRIVELHEGKVHLTSELGVGSCFVITLPYRPSENINEPKPINMIDESSGSVNQSNGWGMKILLAEDNEDNIKVVADYLEVMGYHVVVAHNGQEAIDLVQSFLPDLILMDIQMPVMEGFEAIQRIREIPDFSNIPIIAMTALAMPSDEARCLTSGATDYMSKPVRLKNLHAKIQSYLTSTS